MNGNDRQPGTERSEGGPAVLIVDGDRFFTEVMVRQFVRAGFSVHTAATCEKALAVMRERRPSAVVVDLEIGDMAGYSLFVDMKLDGRLKDIPVIAVWSGRPAVDAYGVESLGAFKVLAKNEITFDDIVSATRQAVAERQRKRMVVGEADLFVIAVAVTTMVLLGAAVAIIASS